MVENPKLGQWYFCVHMDYLGNPDRQNIETNCWKYLVRRVMLADDRDGISTGGHFHCVTRRNDFGFHHYRNLFLLRSEAEEHAKELKGYFILSARRARGVDDAE
jgi:hypothetical protein